jgi:hypothetical protein
MAALNGCRRSPRRPAPWRDRPARALVETSGRSTCAIPGLTLKPGHDDRVHARQRTRRRR